MRGRNYPLGDLHAAKGKDPIPTTGNPSRFTGCMLTVMVGYQQHLCRLLHLLQGQICANLP